MDTFQLILVIGLMIIFSFGTLAVILVQLKIKEQYNKHVENTVESNGYVYPIDWTPVYGYEDVKLIIDDLIFKAIRHRYNMSTGIVGDYRLIKFETDLADITDDVVHAISIPMWMNICYSLNQEYVINYVLWTTEEMIIKYGKEGLIGI